MQREVSRTAEKKADPAPYSSHSSARERMVLHSTLPVSNTWNPMEHSSMGTLPWGGDAPASLSRC